MPIFCCETVFFYTIAIPNAEILNQATLLMTFVACSPVYIVDLGGWAVFSYDLKCMYICVNYCMFGPPTL